MPRPLTVPMLDGLPKINMAVYGEGGSGKTTLLAGFAADPRTSPALWIDAMGNPQLQILGGQIQYGMQIDKWQDIMEPIDYLHRKQPKRHPFRETYEKMTGTSLDGVVFKSLIVDTFTFEQQKIIDHVVDAKKLPAQQRVADTVKIDAKVHGAEIGGTTLQMMTRILTAPVHTFVSYQVYDKLIFVAGNDGSVQNVDQKQQIHLYGSSRNLIPPWHNLMGLLSFTKKLKGNKVERLQVIKWRDTESTGKNQLARSLGEEMEDPTAKDILDKIQQEWQDYLTGDNNNGY